MPEQDNDQILEQSTESDSVSFFALGDSGNEYLVSVDKDDELISISCSCPAGEKQHACKHRIDIIQGDKHRLVLNDPDAEINWVIAQRWISASGLPSALAALLPAIHENEEAQARLKKESQRLKAELARKMSRGC